MNRAFAVGHWFRVQASNPHCRNQNPASYQLDEPGSALVGLIIDPSLMDHRSLHDPVDAVLVQELCLIAASVQRVMMRRAQRDGHIVASLNAHAFARCAQQMVRLRGMGADQAPYACNVLQLCL